MKTLYMAVTADEYELPLYVSDTIKELSDWCGYKSNYISTAIHYHYSGKKSGIRSLKIEVEDD